MKVCTLNRMFIAWFLAGALTVFLLYHWTFSGLATCSLRPNDSLSTHSPDSDIMLPAVVPYLIFFDGCSGSSAFVELMTKHLDVFGVVSYEPLEHLTKANTGFYRDTEYNASLSALQTAFIIDALSVPRSRNARYEWRDRLKERFPMLKIGVTDNQLEKLAAIGFKTRLDFVADKQALATLLYLTHTKIVIYQRRNVVKHALCNYRKSELSIDQFKFKEDKQLKDQKITAAPVRFAEYVDDKIDQKRQTDARLRQYFKGLDIQRFYYEDYLGENGHSTTTQKMVDFLGLPSTTMDLYQVDARLYFEKDSKDDLCEELVNFEELRLFFKTTPYAPLLVCGSKADHLNLD